MLLSKLGLHINRIQGGGVSGPSLPRTANKVFHLSADSLALSEGASVASWIDSVGSATATAAGAAQPTFRTNLFGGKPGVRFDGVANIMNVGRPAALSAAVDSGTFTVAVVCRVISAKATGIMFGAGTSGATFLMQGNGTTMGRYYNGNADQLSYPTNGSGFFVSGVTSGPIKANGFGTGLERAYLNGGCFTCNTAQSPGSGGNNFVIGAKSDSALFSNVEIFEIIAWSTVLSPTEMMQVQAWACNKYTQATPWSVSNKTIVFDGDSITMGIGASSIVGSYPYKTAQSLGLAPGQWHNLGVQGVKSNDMVNNASDFTGIPALTGKPMKVAVFEYYNVRGGPAAAIEGYMNAYSTAIRSVANTKLALGTATSHNADTTGTPDAVKAAYCSYYDTNFATYSDAYVPIHTSGTHIGPVNSTAANPTYFSDGIHLTDLGYTELAGLFTTALTGL